MAGAYGEADVTAQKSSLRSFVYIPALIHVFVWLNGAADLIWKNENPGSFFYGHRIERRGVR